MTEIITIPESWKMQNILENSTLKARIGWQGLTTTEYKKTGKIYLVTGTDFKDGKIDWENCVYVDKKRYSQDKNIQIKIDDVLVTKDGTIGKIAYVDKLPLPTTLNSGIFVIRSIKNDYLHLFLFYILSSNYFIKFLNKLKAGSTIIHLYQKDFASFNFVVPPISEQQQIIQILSNTDKLIEKLEKIIEKKKNIKQGAIQEFLTGKKRLEGFSDEWEEVKFNSLCKSFTKQTGFDYSAHIKPKLVTTFNKYVIPFIQNKDFEAKKINFDTDYYIPEDVANDFPDILLDERCLLISISGSIGDVGIFSNLQKAFIGGAIGVAKFKNKDQLDWVMYYLLSNEGRRKLLKNIKSGAHHNLILADIREITIPIPSLNEQLSITTIFSDMDLEIKELEKNRDKYVMIKNGMMQKLLTGEIRVK